jgi:hypothetical protein
MYYIYDPTGQSASAVLRIIWAKINDAESEYYQVTFGVMHYVLWKRTGISYIYLELESKISIKNLKNPKRLYIT